MESNIDYKELYLKKYGRYSGIPSMLIMGSNEQSVYKTCLDKDIKWQDLLLKDEKRLY